MIRFLLAPLSLLAVGALLFPSHAAVHVGGSTGHGHSSSQSRVHVHSGHSLHGSRHVHRSHSHYSYCRPSLSFGFSTYRPLVTEVRTEVIHVPQTTIIRQPVVVSQPPAISISGSSYQEFHASGGLKLDGRLAGGQRVGTWNWYDEEGRKIQQGEYDAGQRHGIWLRYRPDGSLLYQATFTDGQVVKEIRYSGSGTCVWL